MKKTFYRVYHTKLGADTGQYAFFNDKETAKTFSHNFGNGAGSPQRLTLDTKKNMDDIQEIEYAIWYAENEKEGQ